ATEILTSGRDRRLALEPTVPARQTTPRHPAECASAVHRVLPDAPDRQQTLPRATEHRPQTGHAGTAARRHHLCRRRVRGTSAQPLSQLVWEKSSSSSSMSVCGSRRCRTRGGTADAECSTGSSWNSWSSSNPNWPPDGAGVWGEETVGLDVSPALSACCSALSSSS